MKKQSNPPGNKNKHKNRNYSNDSYGDFENRLYNDFEHEPEFDLEEGYDDYDDDNLEDGEDF